LHPKFYKRIFLWNVKSTPNYSKTLISAGIDTFTLIVCRNNLNQRDRMDCKVITVEDEEKSFVVGSSDRCQCFEIH
jgi:hypothetical protein